MKEIMTNAESRKNVVKALAEHLGEKAVYVGPPSFAYRIGSITVDREGKIILEDESRAEEIEMVLAANGFLGGSGEEPDAEASYTGIRIPVGGLEAQGIINLLNMLHAKQYLINKAVGQDGFSVSDSLITDLEAGTFQNAGEVIDFIGNHGSSNTGFAFLEDTMLNEVKESILNAYEGKTGLSRAKLSHMMDDETWFNAKKAVELGFADRILFDSGGEEGKNPPKEPEKTEGKEGEGKKFPFQQDSVLFSRKAMDNSFLSKVSDGKPMVPVDQLEKRLSLLTH